MFLLVATIFLMLSPAQNWMSHKCEIYDPNNLDQQPHLCPNSNFTASCDHVDDVKRTLASLHPHLIVLCLSTSSPGVTLLPEAFSKFMFLQQLHITGCLGIIHPRAFTGLPNLRLISLTSKTCCASSVSGKSFERLNSLKELYLDNYNLSTMATDVFSGLVDLKVLEILDCVSNFSDILCRLTELSSLTTLTIQAPEIVALSSSILEHSFPKVCKTLKKVSLIFPNLEFLEKNVLRCFGNVQFLKMPLDRVLKAQLFQSGIRRVLNFDVENKEKDLGILCETVFGFSVKYLQLESYSSFEFLSRNHFKHCAGLREIVLRPLRNAELSFISFPENLQVFRLEGNFLQQSLDSFCKTEFVTRLQLFSIHHSNYTKIASRQFICLSNLTTLDLSFNEITVIEDLAFVGLDKLQILYLDSNQVNLLGDMSFDRLFNLEYLDLTHNKISICNFDMFKDLWNLKFLHLRGNKITQITAGRLKALTNLEVLNLEHNVISHIDDFAFTHLGNLQILDLDHNKISLVTTSAFAGLNRLETLMLDFNIPTYIQPSSFNISTALRKFTLGCLQYQHFGTSQTHINLTFIFGKIPVNLNEVHISSCSRPLSIIIGSDVVPQTGLQLRVYGQEVRFQDCERPFFRSVVSLEIWSQQLLCGEHFAGRYFQSLESLFFNSPEMSSFGDLVDINTLSNLKYLKFQTTDLSTQPHLGTMFRNLTRLEQLTFSDSRIFLFEEELSRDLKSLRSLSIIFCKEITVMENFLAPLSQLKYLVISEVLLRCSCNTAWIDEWANADHRVQVTVSYSPVKNGLACDFMGSILNLKDYSQMECFTDLGFLLFASTSLSLLLFMLVVLVHQLAGDYLTAFVYIARGWVEEARRGNAKQRYDYDAFVSYCGKDECWVMEELLPNLEKRGPPLLRLCLHTRDFQLGRDIVENITDSLYKSRRTLCLVSRRYLRSRWCSLEMSLALSRLLAEHRDVLMLVFLEKVPSRLLSAHHRLARLVKTRTYLNWPDDPQQQEAFWDRLWAKLAPPGH